MLRFSLSFFLCELDDLDHLLGDISIALTLMGAQTAGAVLNAILGIGETAAAVFAQGIEGAVAEDATKSLWVGILVAGEVFAGFVLEEIVCHWITSFKLIPWELGRWGSGEGQLLAGFGMAEAEQGGP